MSVTLRPAVTLEDRTRQRLWRVIHAEGARNAEAVRASGAAASARLSLRRAERVRQAIAKLQPLVSRLEAHLREKLRDAMRCGDNFRRLAVEREIDELYRLAREAVEGGEP